MRHMAMFAAGVLALAAAGAAQGNVTPNTLFSDHMVLQQGVKLPVWGTAAAGEQVTVTLQLAEGRGERAKATATAGADGKWMVKLPEQKADGAALELVIAGSNTATIKDVLIGEVWLGSGQSNMVFPVAAKGPYGGLTNADAVIASANVPAVRMFTVADKKTLDPVAAATGAWQVATPQTVPNWSAVGTLLALGLNKQLKVPVGIITAAYGASTAEAWISREALAADPVVMPMLTQFDASVAFFKANPQATYAAAPPRPTPINKARPAGTARAGDPVADQHEPTVLFNGMLAPVIPYAIHGAVWYQGESICGGAHGLDIYGQTLAAMVKDWRAHWGQEGAAKDFPVYIVEIPGQQNLSNNPIIREQQASVMKLVPNVELACCIDTGEAKNVHPRNKAPLGERLTKMALANAYGQKVEYRGPVYDAMKVEGDKVRVTFTHLGAPDHAPGLVAKGGPLKWFQVAGEDQKFVEATAVIEGESVVVSSPAVKVPVAVRYGWDNFPEGCNLFNAADIPASPFRTDTWKYPLAGGGGVVCLRLLWQAYVRAIGLYACYKRLSFV